jgi:hypothetical protein
VSEKDGGPAFPQTYQMHEDDLPTVNDGMSLRDYFAAKAMSAIVVTLPHGAKQRDGSPMTEATVAQQAYFLADAMLKAREATK